MPIIEQQINANEVEFFANVFRKFKDLWNEIGEYNVEAFKDLLKQLEEQGITPAQQPDPVASIAAQMGLMLAQTMHEVLNTTVEPQLFFRICQASYEIYLQDIQILSEQGALH